MANDLLYPMDVRTTGQGPRPLAPPPRVRRGTGGFLLILLVAALATGGWLRLVRPLQQKLALMTRLLAQANGRAAALQQRVTALEAERTTKSAGGGAASAPEEQLERLARQVATARDSLTAGIAPLVDQRRLQLWPHERGLAVSLPGWVPAGPTRHRRKERRGPPEDVVAQLAEQLRPSLGASGMAMTVTAFVCCRPQDKEVRRAGCWRRADALAATLASRWKKLAGVRVMAAVGAQGPFEVAPEGSPKTTEACTVLDFRPEQARPDP